MAQSGYTSDVSSNFNVEDSEAPESVTLTQSKLAVQKHDASVRQAHAAERGKRKERNRERDRRLKEQALGRKQKKRVAELGEEEGGEAGGDDVRLEDKVEEEEDGDGTSELGDSDAVDPVLKARMDRAMQEAMAEDEIGASGMVSDVEEDAVDDTDGDAEEGGDDEWGRVGSDPNEAFDDSEDCSNEEEHRSSPKVNASDKTNPYHLPDHIFKEAFSNASSKKSAKRKAAEDEDDEDNGGQHKKKRIAKKRSRRNDEKKDIVVGSKTIRVLDPNGPLSSSTRSVLPSKKIKKFLDRTLALKSGNARTRGWERRPAHLGVMKCTSAGPASNFVRNR